MPSSSSSSAMVVVVFLLLLPGARCFCCCCPFFVVAVRRRPFLFDLVVRELISHQSWMLRQSCARKDFSRVVRVRIEPKGYISSIVGRNDGQTALSDADFERKRVLARDHAHGRTLARFYAQTCTHARHAHNAHNAHSHANITSRSVTVLLPSGIHSREMHAHTSTHAKRTQNARTHDRSAHVT